MAVPGGATATIPDRRCPACKTMPMQVQGRNMHDDPASRHDTYRADAFCVCGERAGVLRCQIDTLFGIEEDDRVLHGRCRVY